MSKIKLNPGLGAIILVACIFAGWSTLLTVSVLMLLFCEMDEKVKSTMVKVISFLVAITLISMGWAIISEAFDLIISTIEKFISIINCYADSPVTIYKFNKYFVAPFDTLISMVGDIVSFVITVSKFVFIVVILTNKKVKDNFISKKINIVIDKVVGYINATEK